MPGFIHDLGGIVCLGNLSQLRPQILIRDRLAGAGGLRLCGARLTRHVSHGLVLRRQQACRNQDRYNRQGNVGRLSDFHLSHSTIAPSLVASRDSNSATGRYDPISFVK